MLSSNTSLVYQLHFQTLALMAFQVFLVSQDMLVQEDQVASLLLKSAGKVRQALVRVVGLDGVSQDMGRHNIHTM